MVYKIEYANGGVYISEYYGRPTVYLDHWALREIASNKQNRDKFVNSMVKRGGTLRVSSQNIDELIKQSDVEQKREILNMIDSVDSGFIDIDPISVIKKEDKIFRNPNKLSDPSRQIELIAHYLKPIGLPSELKISEIISTARMKKKLDTARKDSEFFNFAVNQFRKIKQRKKKYRIATRYLLFMSIYFILTNNMKMPKPKDWNDLFHVVVPVSYCDMVLIDGT